MAPARASVRWWRGAYYALLFWEGFSEPPKAPIRRRQTLFSVLLQTSRGRQLQDLADAGAQAVLLDPRHYGPTQRLGSWMREEGIEAFEYLSARTHEPLVQVGVFTPAALVSTPFDQVEITGEVNGDHASFLSHDDGTVHRFTRELFLVEGGTSAGRSLRAATVATTVWVCSARCSRS